MVLDFLRGRLRPNHSFIGPSLLAVCIAVVSMAQTAVADEPGTECGSSRTWSKPFPIDPPGSSTGSVEIEFKAVIVRSAEDAAQPTSASLVISMQTLPSGPVYQLTGLSDQKSFGARIPAGRYQLTVQGSPPSSCAPSRIFDVSRDRQSIKIHLGPPAMWHYRAGRALIPARLREETIAIYFNGPAPSKDSEYGKQTLHDVIATASTDEMQAALKLLSAPKPLGSFGTETKAFPVWELGLTDISLRGEILDRLQSKLATSAQVGTLVEPYHSGLRFADGRFIVRSGLSIKQESLKNTLATRSAKLLRQLDPEARTWLVGFSQNRLSKNLSEIEALIDSGVLEDGQLDLVASSKTNQLPSTWPNDEAYFLHQYVNTAAPNANHKLQMIREAWALLSDRDLSSRHIGSGDVYVATLDRGILRDKETECTADDGLPQIAQCFDAGKGKACEPAGHELDIDDFGKPIRHGMAVFGVLGACVDNATTELPDDGNIAGVAPGIHHIVVKKPEPVGGLRYADTLLWLAGLDINCPLEQDPAELGVHPCNWPKLSKPASVINCSHQMVDDDLSPHLSDVFNRLVTEGRDTKGVLLVYSAGNDRHPVEEVHALAADPRTIAVSNCEVTNGTPSERLQQDSNFGEKIDVCALGENVPTISGACGQNGQICRGGGTSAAAPQVSGTIALMLSANRGLTLDRIRVLIRESADRATLDETSDSKCHFVAGRSVCYGSGRLNTCRAVAAALRDGGISVPLDACTDH